jgi:hypothetical protein
MEKESRKSPKKIEKITIFVYILVHYLVFRQLISYQGSDEITAKPNPVSDP